MASTSNKVSGQVSKSSSPSQSTVNGATTIERDHDDTLIWALMNYKIALRNSKENFFDEMSEIIWYFCDEQLADRVSAKFNVGALTENPNWVIAGSAAVSYIIDRLTAMKNFELSKTTGKPSAAQIETLPEPLRGLVKSVKPFTSEQQRRHLWSFVKTLDLSDGELAIAKAVWAMDMPLIIPNFTPKDTDIFFLNSAASHRLSLPKLGVDIVHSRTKTPCELLSDFDLPCCRAAFNSTGDIWISIGCMAAIFSGTYYVPTYLEHIVGFSARVQKSMKDEVLDETLVKSTDNDRAKFLVRLNERMDKYEKYGFRAEYIHCDKMLPWIGKRFDYQHLDK